MNRSVVQNTQTQHRDIDVSSANYKMQVQKWTSRILKGQPCVPDGYRFTWANGNASCSNTAYMYDAVMCNLQYAQSQLVESVSHVGKLSYTKAIDAASTLQYVLRVLLPQWTFRPQEVYNIPDTAETDIYGHYCLARAVAYDSVGKADLVATPKAQIAAASNAAHLYYVAALCISGNVSAMIDKAQICTANALVQWSKVYLQQWEQEQDMEGAAKALACLREAQKRYLSSGHHGCEDAVQYATGRNQIHWITPVLPRWESLVRPRISILTATINSQASAANVQAPAHSRRVEADVGGRNE